VKAQARKEKESTYVAVFAKANLPSQPTSLHLVFSALEIRVILISSRLFFEPSELRDRRLVIGTAGVEDRIYGSSTAEARSLGKF
jgi:hypothetical protein